MVLPYFRPRRRTMLACSTIVTMTFFGWWIIVLLSSFSHGRKERSRMAMFSSPGFVGSASDRFFLSAVGVFSSMDYDIDMYVPHESDCRSVSCIAIVAAHAGIPLDTSRLRIFDVHNDTKQPQFQHAHYEIFLASNRNIYPEYFGIGSILNLFLWQSNELSRVAMAASPAQLSRLASYRNVFVLTKSIYEKYCHVMFPSYQILRSDSTYVNNLGPSLTLLPAPVISNYSATQFSDTTQSSTVIEIVCVLGQKSWFAHSHNKYHPTNTLSSGGPSRHPHTNSKKDKDGEASLTSSISSNSPNPLTVLALFKDFSSRQRKPCRFTLLLYSYPSADDTALSIHNASQHRVQELLVDVERLMLDVVIKVVCDVSGAAAAFSETLQPNVTILWHMPIIGSVHHEHRAHNSSVAAAAEVQSPVTVVSGEAAMTSQWGVAHDQLLAAAEAMNGVDLLLHAMARGCLVVSSGRDRQLLEGHGHGHLPAPVTSADLTKRVLMTTGGGGGGGGGGRHGKTVERERGEGGKDRDRSGGGASRADAATAASPGGPSSDGSIGMIARTTSEYVKQTLWLCGASHQEGVIALRARAQLTARDPKHPSGLETFKSLLYTAVFRGVTSRDFDVVVKESYQTLRNLSTVAGPAASGTTGTGSGGTGDEIVYRKVAVIVEPGVNAYFEYCVRNVMHYLGSDWTLRVYHSKSNQAYVRGALADMKDVLFIDASNDIHSIADYNRLPKQETFWRPFNHNATKVLLFQSDSIMLKPGMDQYLHYDYIGAPWNVEYNERIVSAIKSGYLLNGVGNGGFSLRTGGAMYRIAKQFGPSSPDIEQEDIFFAHHLESLGYAVAPRSVAQGFAWEVKCADAAAVAVHRGNPLALHAAWYYHDRKEMAILLRSAIPK